MPSKKDLLIAKNKEYSIYSQDDYSSVLKRVPEDEINTQKEDKDTKESIISDVVTRNDKEDAGYTYSSIKLTREERSFLYKASVSLEMSKGRFIEAIIEEEYNGSKDIDDDMLDAYRKRMYDGFQEGIRMRADIADKMKKRALELYLKPSGYMRYVIDDAMKSGKYKYF